MVKVKTDIFRAIADPTRREIITMVARKPLNLNAIADNFEITRQAVSLHVKILTDSRLIVIKKIGRERYCEARLEKLDEVSDWVSDSKKLWAQRFKSLENFLDELQEESTSKTKRKKNGRKK